MKIFGKTIAMIVLVTLLCTAVAMLYVIYPLRYTHSIRLCSEQMDIDPYLVTALIKAESNFDCDATSSKNAKGVMQLTDETAEFCARKMGIELNDSDVYDPTINITLGCCYLRRTLDIFNQDETLAIAAYNAGEGRVKEWLADKRYSADGEKLDNIPYEETKNHVKKIELYRKIYKILYPNL